LKTHHLKIIQTAQTTTAIYSDSQLLWQWFNVAQSILILVPTMQVIMLFLMAVIGITNTVTQYSCSRTQIKKLLVFLDTA